MEHPILIFQLHNYGCENNNGEKKYQCSSIWFLQDITDRVSLSFLLSIRIHCPPRSPVQLTFSKRIVYLCNHSIA